MFKKLLNKKRIAEIDETVRRINEMLICTIDENAIERLTIRKNELISERNELI